MFAVIIAPQYLFGNDERGRLDTLYTALGIPRSQVVAGRYAASLLLLIALTVAGLILAPVTALVLGVELDWAIAAALAAGSVGIVGALLAVELPAYFALGAARARTVGFAVPAATCSRTRTTRRIRGELVRHLDGERPPTRSLRLPIRGRFPTVHEGGLELHSTPSRAGSRISVQARKYRAVRGTTCG